MRLLAKHYGVDEQELLHRYEQAAAPHRAVSPPLPLAQTNATIFKVQSGRRHAGLGVGVGLIVAVLLLFGWMRSAQEPLDQTPAVRGSAKASVSRSSSQPVVQQDKPRQAEEQKVVSAAPDQPAATLKSPPVPPPTESVVSAIPTPEPPPLRLEIEAHEQSWVQAALDGGEMKEALLQPGERLIWTATDQMELTLGNAGGLALLFNGEALAALGETGQVVRLHLTKDGLGRVRRSAPPHAPQPPPSTLSTPAPSTPSTFAF